MVEAGMLFRVSSKGQEDGYSLQDQEHDCRVYADKQGYHVADAHIWNDGAQKSWTLNRPGLQAAIQAIHKGDIQVLLVGRYDRFSRVQMQQAVAIYEIEHIHGGRVESSDPKEQFGTDSTGVLLRSVNAWRAEQELELIKDRTQTGRRLRAQSGKLIASPFPLYGYLWADEHDRRGKSRYVVDHEAAPIIQRIFSDVAAGTQLRTVARTLTAEGVPTPANLLIARGFVTPQRFRKMTGDWSKTMLVRIVTNSAYIGKYVAFRTLTNTGQTRTPEGHLRVQSRTIMRPKDDPSRTVLSADVCPAIVSEEVFTRVQQQLGINKQEASRNQRSPEAYLLRGGFAFSGHCGATMTANTSGPVGKKILTYRCTRAGSSTVNRCEGGSYVISTTVLDKAVWTAITYLFSDPKRIRAVLETQLSVKSDEESREEARKQAIEGRLRQVIMQKIIQASYEERRYLLRGLKTKVTCYKTGHDPRYVIEWDMARLQEPLRNLLPNFTDKDVAAIYESNNTYFRQQSPDYVPGSGFVPVAVDK